MSEAGYAIGVDIGGTFTDCVVLDPGGRVTTGKVPTTPDDRSRGFFASIDAAAAGLGMPTFELLARCERLIHGTTTGTNALVSRTGARVGLLTTAGHADVMRIMKGSGRTVGLPSDQTLDVPATHKPEPLVEVELTRGIRERIDVDGEVVVALHEDDVARGAAELVEAGAEAIAISFLWSIVNPAHEQRAREIVASVAPESFLSCASEISARVGEYERTAAAVANAYIGPLMSRYVGAIVTGARERGFHGPVLFSQCAGGAITAEEARAIPLRTVQSGPVAGLIGTAMLAERLGRDDVVAADMGGTTLDVSVIHRGEPVQRDVSLLERFAMALPMLDVESIGAGGGSIAWIDDVGRLSVGPRSAGADPGPACYGKGGVEPTVTDADVVLGIVDPDGFLGGRMRLDRERAEAAIAPLAERLGLSVLETAAGINQVVDAKMADLVRRVSLLRGFDPRRFDCFSFGGGGPVHMTAVAAQSGIRRVVVPLPRTASVWSALGAAGSDVTHVLEEWRAFDLPVDPAAVNDVFAGLEARAHDTLASEGFAPDAVAVRRAMHMRYAMQVHDVEVPVGPGVLDGAAIEALDEEFGRIHDELFGRDSGFRQGGVQITGFQVRAVGTTTKPALAAEERADATVPERRSVYWYELGRSVDTPVLRSAAATGDEDVPGPALIELAESVIVIRPGQVGGWDALGNFVIELDAVPDEGTTGVSAVAEPAAV